MPEIIGLGSIFVDYFFKGNKGFLKKYHLSPEDDCLFEAKKTSLSAISRQLPLLNRSPGGMTPNTIAVLSKLGIKVAYSGVLGKDRNAAYWLKNIGNFQKKAVRKGKTSVCACILTDRGLKRAFLYNVNPADNDFFLKPQINWLNQAKIIYIGNFCLYPEKNIDNLIKLVQKLKKPMIAFAPSIVYGRLGFNKLKPILKKTKFLFINSDEVRLLTGETINKGIKKLLSSGVKVIVCTLGSRGVRVIVKKSNFYLQAKKVKKIIDTTGAGDAFAAGFLFGILKKKSLKWSAAFANKVAAKSITGFGLSWLKNIEEFKLDAHNIIRN